MKPSEQMTNQLGIQGPIRTLKIPVSTLSKWRDEVAQLEEIAQAAVDYFEDGITNKEQYAAYERFVVAVQPWFEAEGK